jgi:hypothetical protein
VKNQTGNGRFFLKEFEELEVVIQLADEKQVMLNHLSFLFLVYLSFQVFIFKIHPFQGESFVF